MSSVVEGPNSRVRGESQETIDESYTGHIQGNSIESYTINIDESIDSYTNNNERNNSIESQSQTRFMMLSDEDSWIL